MTQQRLATLASCDVKSVRRAEQGKNLDYITLEGIAIALGTQLEEVLALGNDKESSRSSNVQAIRRWHDAFDQRDIDQMVDICHPRAMVTLPVLPEYAFGGEFNGKDEIRKSLESLIAIADSTDAVCKKRSIHLFGDHIFSKCDTAVRSPQNGAQIEFLSMCFFRMSQGKILELHNCYDTLAIARVLGN